MKLKLKYLLPFLISLSGCSQVGEPSVRLLEKDFEARTFLKAEKYEEALQSYFSLVEINPNYAGTHSNIGVLLNMVQKPEEALKSLEHGLQVAKASKDLGAEFAIHYNLGTYFGQLKKIDEAIQHYQAALDIAPGSIEAKTNIELLIQQQKQDGQSGEQSKDKQNQEGKSGENESQNDKSNQEKKDDKKDGQEKDKENKDNKDEKDQDKEDGQKRESSPKYKPRPFKGEELSEGDVKKILGELRNQEQKIRANFEKKEKGKTKRNEKDW